MDILIEIMLPVFGVVLFGAVARAFKWIDDPGTDAVGKFVFSFAVPCLLLRTVGTTDLPAEPPWAFLASFYVGAVLLYAGGMLVGRFAFRRPPMGQTLTGMSFAFGNTVMVGLPITLAVYGDAGALPFFIILSVHGLLYFTATTVLLELQYQVGERAGLKALPKAVGRSLVTNPILIGIAGGLAVNLSGVALPGPIDQVCRVMQGAVPPCALFVLGASLVRHGIRGRVAQAVVVSIAKLLVFPAITYLLAFHVFDLPRDWAEIAVLTSGLPLGVMAFVFSQKYGTGQAITATSVSMSTAASLFTLWGLLVLLRG